MRRTHVGSSLPRSPAGGASVGGRGRLAFLVGQNLCQKIVPRSRIKTTTSPFCVGVERSTHLAEMTLKNNHREGPNSPASLEERPTAPNSPVSLEERPTAVGLPNTTFQKCLPSLLHTTQFTYPHNAQPGGLGLGHDEHKPAQQARHRVGGAINTIIRAIGNALAWAFENARRQQHQWPIPP